MKHIFFRLFACCLCISLSLGSHQALAETYSMPVWKLADHNVYFVGTIHILNAADVDKLEQLKPLVARSQHLYLETTAVFDEAEQQQMAVFIDQHAKLPEGQTLHDIISPKSYAELEKITQEIDVEVKTLDTFKPWMINILLAHIAGAKLGATAEHGVDKALYDMAQAQETPLAIHALESPTAALEQLNSLSFASENRCLEKTIAYVEEHPDSKLSSILTTLKWVINSWRSNDTTELATFNALYASVCPEQYKAVLADRNQAWLPIIDKAITRDEPTIIAAGLAHFIGATSLVELLQAEGYTVQRLR